MYQIPKEYILQNYNKIMEVSKSTFIIYFLLKVEMNGKVGQFWIPALIGYCGLHIYLFIRITIVNYQINIYLNMFKLVVRQYGNPVVAFSHN